MPKILLHVCCGPCSLMPIKYLREEGWELTAFYYNPNIHPQDEWRKRAEAMKQVSQQLDVPLIIEGEPVIPYSWVQDLKGIIGHGDRCKLCYRPRLQRTAELARERNFDAFSTSLLYSKYQLHEVIADMARKFGDMYGPSFLYRDFREYWWEGIALSKEMGIYRQKWCGCILSMKEAKIQKEERDRIKAERKNANLERLQKEAEEREKHKKKIC